MPGVRTQFLLLSLGVLLAACGGNAHEAAFAAEYRELSAQYEARVSELGEAADVNAERAELLSVYEEFREAAVEARDAFADLMPPEDFEGAVDRLVANLDDQVDALDGLVEAAEADDPEGLAVHLEELAALVTDWAQTNQLVLERLPD